MSAVAIILIILAAALIALFVGGLVATRWRKRTGAADYSRHVAAADRALEQARAADRGWERGGLEAAARAALQEHRPGFTYEELALILVDDRPGVTEDRAHFAAIGGDGEVRLVLVRGEQGWRAERVD